MEQDDNDDDDDVVSPYFLSMFLILTCVLSDSFFGAVVFVGWISIFFCCNPLFIGYIIIILILSFSLLLHLILKT